MSEMFASVLYVVVVNLGVAGSCPARAKYHQFIHGGVKVKEYMDRCVFIKCSLSICN